MEKIKLKNKQIKYRESIMINGKVKKSPTFSRKSDARNWKAQKIAEREKIKLHGNSIIVHEIDFESFCNRWLANRKNMIQPSSYLEYEALVRNKFVPIFKNKMLKDFVLNDGESLLNTLLSQGHNAGGVNKILALFKSIFNYAEKTNYIVKSPFKALSPLKEPSKKTQFWTMDDACYYLSNNKDHKLYEIVFVALNTGMRRGELCGLTWDKIDFTRKLIEVSSILDRHGYRNRTKSGKSRLVPINTELKSFLIKMKNKSKSDFLFVDKNQEVINPHHINRTFQKSQKDIGLSNQIRFHDLRHTFASHFMMNSGSPYELQKILGHHDFSMTEIYAHLSPEHLANATEIVSFKPVLNGVYPLFDQA